MDRQESLKLNMNEYLPLRDVVFNTLRRAILTGNIRPGERLMEVQLSQMLGVSRTPIREAIRKLELEGLVETLPRRGAQVAKISEKSLKDVLEVRRALDVLIAELACIRISEEQLIDLQNAQTQFEMAVKQASDKDIDTAEIAKADVEFHNIIMEATGNERLISLVNNLAEQMYRYRFVYLKDQNIHEKLILEHKDIYEAIRNRDVERAKNAAAIHIDNQEKEIIEHIRSECEEG